MISHNQNPWVKRLKDDEIQKNQMVALNAMVKKARELMADERFKDYKKLYESYHASEIENIMMLAEQDPVKYAFKVRQIVDTLKAYRLLISSIEDNASIQIEEEIK